MIMVIKAGGGGEMQGRRWAGSLAAAVLCLAAAGAISEAHATTPSVSSLGFDANNDGTWAAVLTINFNTPMEWQTSEEDALGKIVLKRGHSTSQETRRATGSSMEFDGNSIKVYYLPLGEEIVRSIARGALSLYIDGSALQSADTQTALPQYGVPGQDGRHGPRVPYSIDSTRPEIATLTLDRANRVLSIVADEALTYGAYPRTPTYPTNLYVGNDDNSTKFHIRDGVSASSGGITMNKDTNTPSVHRNPPHEIRFNLTPGQINTVVAYAQPHLHVDVEAFSGLNSDGNPTDNAIIRKPINFLPQPTVANLLPSTRALSVTFDEAVTRENGAFYIRGSASGDYDLATDVAGVLAISGTVGTSTLTSGGVAKVQAMSTPHLHLEAGAVKDSEGAANGKAVVSLTVGDPPPRLLAATIDRASGAAVLTFDKSVTKGTGNIDIRDGPGAAHDAGTDVRVAASHSAVSASGSALTFTWASSALIKINAMSSPYVYLGASAAVDSGGTGNDALASGQDAVLSPRLASAHLAPSSLTLSATFSERVAAPPSSPGRVYVGPAGDAAFTPGTDVHLVLSGTAVTHSAKLTAAEYARVAAMSTPTMYAEANAATVSGLSNAALSVPLTIEPPRVTHTRFNFNSVPGVVTITFSYDVTRGAGNVDMLDSTTATYNAATHVRLSATDASVSGNRLIFELSEAERQKGLSNELDAVRLPSGAVSGLGGSNPAESRSVDLRNLDALSPLLVSASLDDATGVLTLTFNETMDASSINRALMRLQDGASASGGTVLNGATATNVDGVSITITLTSGQRTAAAGYADLHVRLVSDAIRDLWSNLLLTVTKAVSTTNDTTAPTLSSAALDEGTGILTLTFSETVDVSSASDGTRFEIRDGASATDNLASEAVLSTAEIQSGQSDGTAFKFNLNETSRQAVISMSNPHMYIAAGAITDTATPTANSIAAKAAGTDISQTFDDDAPAVSSADMHEDTGVLTVTFSETVDVSSADGAKFELRDGARATDNLAGEVVLSTAEIQQGQSDGLELKFKLSETSRQGVIALGDPHLYAAAGAINDAITMANSGRAPNPIAADADGVNMDQTLDTSPPEVSSAALDEGTGILTITFSETVDVSSADGAKFELRDGARATDNLAGEVVLSTAEIQSGQQDGAEFKFELSEDSRQGAIAMTAPYLYVAAGAINDAITVANSGVPPNAIAADTDGTMISLTTDGAAPTIVSAEATALNKITVTFSEKAKTTNTGGEGWSVSGTDAGALQVTQNSDISSGATEVVLTLSGNLPDTKPDIALRYEISGADVPGDPGSGSGAVTDTSNNALAARSNIAVSDGIKPEIVSSRITGPNEITITYGEAVTAAQSHYASAQIGTARTISGLSGGTTDTHTLTFSGTAAGTDATGSVTLDATQIQDAAGNALGTSASLSRNLADGQSPAVTSATATSLREITVTFSESLASSGANAQGWSVSGGDAGGRTVVSSSGSGSSLVLTLSSDLDDTKPDGVLLRYKTSAGDVGSDPDSGSGAIRDGASNALAARSNIAVSDGIKPEIVSSRITGPNEITITYGEAVTAAQSHYASAQIGTARTISGLSGGTTDTHTLTFSGTAAGTDATGSVTLDATQIQDAAGNALGTSASLSRNLADGQAPAITSAKATSPTTIEVTFSESLASGAGEQGWSVSGGDAAGRNVASAAGSGNSLVLTLDSGLADTRPDGVLLRYKTSAGDVGSDANSGAGAIRDGASNALAARSNIAVSDGIAPAVSSSKYTSRNAVELTFSEPVRLASGSAPTGWAATGADAVASPTSASSITTLTTSSATSAAVLTLDSDLADKTLLDFTLSYSNGNIEDESDNALAPYSEKPDDGIAPVVLSAQSRALNEITVIFSEAVTATGTAGAGGWTISGSDSNSRLVSSRTGISSSASNTLTLTLDGNLNEPIGTVALAYDGSGDAKDRSDNALAAQSVPVSQNLPPTISSAKITGPNRATITYSEPVTASAGAYSGLTVGAARSITSYTQTQTATHVLVFGGPSAGTGASGTLTIDQSKISDGVLNLGTSSVQRNLTDGQAPTFSAGVTDERTVLVTFSEQVSSSDNAASHWTLSGADAQAVSSVSALSNSGTMAITVGADFAANVADLKISYSAAGTVSDSAGNVLASVSAAAVSDEQRPSIASAVASSADSIIVTLTRSSTGSATAAGTTWTLSGTDAAGLSVSGYPGVSSDTLILGLSGSLPDTAPNLSLSYNAGAGDIADSAGKQMIDQTVPVSDGLKPRIDGAALNEGTGVLSVTFTEPVSVASGLHLRESGASGGIPLPSASGTVLSFTLSEAQRQQAVAFATPSLRMDAGAAADGAGLSSDAADVPVSATADAVPPVAGSAFLDLGTGILTISFDENLGPASDPSSLSISGSLTGAQVSVSGSTATVSLTEQQRQAAIGQTSPSLVLGAGAFRDVSGTGSSAVTLPLQTAPDDDRPRLVTAALNTDTSILVLEFDETMDVSAFSAQLTHVRITGGAQEIQVSGTVSRDGVKVRVQVDRPTLNAVLDSVSASLRLETRGAQFEDTSGNAAPQADAELAIGDDSPPRLVSASVISPDTVLAVFHEDLDGSSVQPSDFEVGGLTPVSVSEERGTVTLKLDAEYDERSAPTVSLAGPVSDLFGNAQNSGSVQSVNNIVRVTVSEFTVSASGGLAVAGEQVSILFRATEQVQNPALSINGDSVPVTPAENGFTASYVVPAGSPQGPLSVSLSVESRTGTPASFTERDLTGPNVSVDTVPPEILSASASGTDSATIRYSEPVLAGATGASAEVSSATYTVSVSGSGSETILVSWDGDGTVPASAVLRGLDVRDPAGNPSPADPVNAGAASDAASPGPTGVLPIAKGTTLRTVTVQAGVEPALELSSASATDPRVLFAGGRTAELENPLSVITREPGLPDLFFQAGTEVGGLAGLTVAGADLEAAVLVSKSDYEVPSGSPALDAYPQLRSPATSVLVGSPASDIAFSKPVRMEFDVPLSGLVFTVNAAGDVLPIPACAEGYGGDVPLLQEAPDLWPPETYDPLACVSGDSVWTLHFSVFGVAYPSSGGSECDDCTPPTLGYDAYGARLVEGGFAYNGLASDVEYFFTPYPLIESEVGKQNTVVLKMYENEGPANIERVSVAFGLRSGEVISESRAVINYDILHDGTGSLSVIDPENAIDLETLSAEHRTVECSPGSSLQCLSVSVRHSFRAPLDFDIVGTDVWDRERNSWQNYFNHGLRITGESMNPVPGVAVNGGELVLHPIVENSNNVEVMASQDGQLYRLAPDGLYKPLRNISSLFHSIDESMYTYRGTPMQGYDRSDPEFADALEEQIRLAKAVLESMNLGRQGWHEGFEESESSVHAAIDRMERLQESLQSERERAERTFLDRYGPTDRPE